MANICLIILVFFIIIVIKYAVFKIAGYLTHRSLRSLRMQYSTRMKLEIQEMANHQKTKISEAKSTNITGLSFDNLCCKLQAGELSCVEVLWAYQLKAFTENVTLNFIAQPIREAEQTARELDLLDLETRKSLPLFGIPVSVKEDYHVAGYTSTIGVSNLLTNQTDNTAVVLQALKDAGAVPFIRTNLSQTMLSFGAHNPLYGQTRNPKDPKRSPGGSSAGEGAAIGAGASILGLGSDIGGSVRVPAAWCGICALKLTSGRSSSLHWTAPYTGLKAINGATGIMGRDVSSLVVAMRTFSSDVQFHLDPSVPRALFNDEDYSSNKSLTIGYINTDMGLAATESAKQAVTRVVAELKGQGHRVIQWQVPTCKKLPAPGDMLKMALFGDGGAQISLNVSQSELSHCTSTLLEILAVPACIRRWLTLLPQKLLPANWTKNVIRDTCRLKSVDDWARLQTNIDKYRQLWIDDWKSKGIDAIILPAVPVPAEFIDKCCVSGLGAYCYLFNLVNFPAGVVPVGEISEKEEENDWRCYPHSTESQKKRRQVIRGSAGLPLSIQCATLPFREEICLRLMDIISTMTLKRSL